jgi:hypothetical protein
MNTTAPLHIAPHSGLAHSSSSASAALWIGRVIGALGVLFLAFDGAMKLVQPAPVVEASSRLGFSGASLVAIGVVLLVSTLLYVIPRTAVLGAVLLTGYLGGAVATHVRSGDPAFPILFPVIFGTLLWVSLYLRSERLRAFVRG